MAHGDCEFETILISPDISNLCVIVLLDEEMDFDEDRPLDLTGSVF